MSKKPTATPRLRLHLIVLAAAVLTIGSGFFLITKHQYLMPGPLSAKSTEGQALGGYISHAEFENECGHCHAPVHCITDTRCQDCHSEIARQRTHTAELHSRLPGVSRCQTCHQEHQGRDAAITKFAFVNVNHEKLAGFSLALHQTNYDGSPMNCSSCHIQDRYVADSLDCISCHSQDDHDLMAAHIEEFGTGCVDCHDGQDRMENFDHNLHYALEGAHSAAECDACHLEKNYHTTPADCSACHAEPQLHAGIFGLDCARCHTATAWSPAQLVQHTFLLDHGSETIANCENCHAGAYTEYPCYTCHEIEEMRSVHIDEDQKAIEDCISCHPTGRDSELAGPNQGAALARIDGK